METSLLRKRSMSASNKRSCLKARGRDSFVCRHTSTACDLVEGICKVSTRSAEWLDPQLANGRASASSRLGRQLLGAWSGCSSLSCIAVRSISQEAVSVVKLARMGLDLYQVALECFRLHKVHWFLKLHEVLAVSVYRQIGLCFTGHHICC